MNFKMIEKLRQLPRHGVLPRSRAAARGLENLTISYASASPTATPSRSSSR
jgi:hypothetical protein